MDKVCLSSPSSAAAAAAAVLPRLMLIGDVMCVVWCVQLCYGERSKLLFSGSRDTTVRMWNLNSKVEVASFRGHTLPVAGLAINAGTAPLSPSPPPSASLRCTDPNHLWRCAILLLTSDNTTLCSGGRDYSVRFWDVERKEQLKMKTEPRNVVCAAANVAACAVCPLRLLL